MMPYSTAREDFITRKRLITMDKVKGTNVMHIVIAGQGNGD